MPKLGRPMTYEETLERNRESDSIYAPSYYESLKKPINKDIKKMLSEAKKLKNIKYHNTSDDVINAIFKMSLKLVCKIILNNNTIY